MIVLKMTNPTEKTRSAVTCLLVLAQTHGRSATSDLTGHDTGSHVGCQAACLQRDAACTARNDKDPAFKRRYKVL